MAVNFVFLCFMRPDSNGIVIAADKINSNFL